MSGGIGAYANKVMESSEIIVYNYGGYNLNVPEYQNKKHIYDGHITISKSCFAELETHKNLNKIPSGHKNNIPKMINDGLIEFKNCSNCWYTTTDDKHIDLMALHILFRLFHKYQEEDRIPDYISYNV